MPHYPLALILGVFLGVLVACSPDGRQQAADRSQSGQVQDTCSTQDQAPKAAPMAVAMRSMLLQAQAMHDWLSLDSPNRGAMPAWSPMPFESQRPTDSSSLDASFFKNAKAYQNAFAKVGQEPNAAHFNALVNQCVQCHQGHCPGPIKRIERLKL